MNPNPNDRLIEQESARIAAQYSGVFDAPPNNMVVPHTPCGAMLGNGDVGVVVGGPPDALTLYIGKNEFWSVENGAVTPLGRVRLNVPAIADASYHLEQDIFNAEVRARFTLKLVDFSDERVELSLRSWLHARQNILAVELSNTGHHDISISADLLDGTGNFTGMGTGSSGSVRWLKVASDPNRSWKRPSLCIGRKPAVSDVRIHGKASSPSQLSATKGSLKHVPHGPFTITARVRLTGKNRDISILSTGEWDSAVNCAVVGGKLRMGTHGVIAEAAESLQTGGNVSVAGVFDGARIRFYIDGCLCDAPMKLAKEPVPADIWAPNATFGCIWRGSGPPTGAGPRAVMAACMLSSHRGAAVVLKPGESTVLAVTILSETDNAAFETEAVRLVKSLTIAKLAKLNQSHRQWWRAFYGKSFVEIPNKIIEKHWYASLYLLACCSRGDEVAPGLWGNWITHPYMWWHGDYTLNYNYQSPFWGAFHANHVELTNCYDTPLLDWLPRGLAQAAALGHDGAFYLTHIGPLPGGSSDLATHGQKYQLLFAVINCLMRRRFTCDKSYTRKIYPLLIETAKFWETYLVFENGRYVIKGDSAFECVDSGDINPVTQLGMLRMLFRDMLDISKELKVDGDRRERWQHILDHLSDFPVIDAATIVCTNHEGKEVTLEEAFGAKETKGVKVHRMTERGYAWGFSNAVGLQHIFPTDVIGLESEAELLDIARNTIHLHGLSEPRWRDGNGTPTFYPAAARVGYNPALILEKLAGFLSTCCSPNMHPFVVGGGIECLSVVPACLGEMLCQSHQGVIIVFANWPKGEDGRFGNFRACGSFLVSSERSGGITRFVRIESEKGGPCVLKNPWPGEKARVKRNTTSLGFLGGEYLHVNTARGNVFVFEPPEDITRQIK